MASLGLLGIPSSSAAHWPGQEKAPEALRAAGLTALLAETGHRVIDHGDRPVVRWRPHPHQRRPHDLTRTLEVLRDARSQVAAIFRAGQIPLVVGGECTLTIAVVSAAVEAGHEVGLVYFDGGPDLRTPVDNPVGVLDSMGVAHLLDLPGSEPELAGLGTRKPLLTPDRVCFFGQSSRSPDAADATVEDRTLDSLPSRKFGAAEVARDPSAAAREAISVVTASTDRFLVHFDVDVIDFFDLPVADVPQHNTGLTFAAAMAALTVLVGHPAFAGLIITEFNPDHGEPNGSTARILATGLAAALGRRSAGASDPS
jgi:arginase